MAQNKGFRFLVFLCWLLLAVGCVEPPIYQIFRTLQKEQWFKDDTLYYEPVLTDSCIVIDLSLGLRYGYDYPYSNFSVLISHNLRDPAHWETDTLTVELINGREYRGEGIGQLFQTMFPVGSFFAEHGGRRMVKVTHNMTRGRLDGIRDVGIQIIKAQ